MHNNFANKRQSHRMAVRDMDYHAKVAVGTDLIDSLVLDYSALGMQVELPASASIPSEGIVLFRNQAYNYQIKHEAIGEDTKRFGLATTGIVEPTKLSQTDRRGYQPRDSQHSPERHRIRRTLSHVAIWVVVSLGTSAVCAFFCGHGTDAKDLYFRIFAERVARASIEHANESARKMNEIAKEVAESLDATTGDFSELARDQHSATKNVKSKTTAAAKAAIDEYDNVVFEEN